MSCRNTRLSRSESREPVHPTGPVFSFYVAGLACRKLVTHSLEGLGEMRFVLSIPEMKWCLTISLRQPVKFLSHPHMLNPARQSPGKLRVEGAAWPPVGGDLHSHWEMGTAQQADTSRDTDLRRPPLTPPVSLLSQGGNDSRLGTSPLALSTQKRQGPSPASEYHRRVRRDTMQAAKASSYFDCCTPLN